MPGTGKGKSGLSFFSCHGYIELTVIFFAHQASTSNRVTATALIAAGK
jgi:hypothetical protein